MKASKLPFLPVTHTDDLIIFLNVVLVINFFLIHNIFSHSHPLLYLHLCQYGKISNSIYFFKTTTNRMLYLICTTTFKTRSNKILGNAKIGI